MQQGIVSREVYMAQHPPYIYQGVPPGWITVREVAERLDISIGAAQRLRRMKRFMSEQFVGDWDTKKRPWFCDEDGVEAYKNNEEYQRWRRIGQNAMRAMIGKLPLTAEPAADVPTEKANQAGDHMRPDKITFGYTAEELRMPRDRITGINDVW